MENDKIIVVDFDGTICEHHYPDVGPPKPMAREALERLKKAGYRILIHTVRTASYWQDFGTEDPDAHLQKIREFMEKRQIPYDGIWEPDKPLATYIIDDVAIAYEENWDEIANRLAPAAPPVLTVMMGLPLAGKTYYCRKKASDCARICLDELAISMGFGRNRRNALSLARIEERIIKTFLDSGKDVIVDGENLGVNDRAKYINMTSDRRLKTRLIYMSAGPDLCWERNHKLNPKKQISFQLMEQAKRDLQPPLDNEGFDEIIVVKPSQN